MYKPTDGEVIAIFNLLTKLDFEELRTGKIKSKKSLHYTDVHTLIDMYWKPTFPDGGNDDNQKL